MDYEENLPTQQTAPQKDPRIPQAHENCRRTKSIEPQTPQRAQDTFRVKTGPFPKAHRLRDRSDFQSMKTGSRRVVGKTLCLDLKPASTSSPRLGITASGKFGSSCERNRFKRLVREAFRRVNGKEKVDIHAVPRQRAKGAKLSDVLADFEGMLSCDRPQS